MPSTIVKTTHAKDFLALVPQLVGFEPRDSIVLVAFRGNRTCGAMRVDLPDVQKQELHKRITTTLLGMFCKLRGADAIVPVIYTGTTFAEHARMPHHDFASMFVKRAELCGFVVHDALCMAADGWGSYLDADCPASGRSLGDIVASSARATLQHDFPKRLESPQQRATLPNADLWMRERVGGHLRTLQRVGGEATHISSVITFNEHIHPVLLAESMLKLDVETLKPGAAAMVLYAIQAPPHRDQITLQFAFGAAVGTQAHVMNMKYLLLQAEDGRPMDEIILDEIARGERGERAESDDGGDLLLGQSTKRPDVRRVEQGIQLLKTVTAVAPRWAQPAPLCMLAWLNWSLGWGSAAGLFIDQALRVDPHYGMAELLATLLNSGALPEWAFHEPGQETSMS